MHNSTNLRSSAECFANVLSLAMTDTVIYIGQFQWDNQPESCEYWAPVSEHLTLLTHLRQSCCFNWDILGVQVHLRCTPQFVGWWDLATVTKSKPQHLLLDTFWHVMKVQAHLISAILSSIMFLKMDESNFDRRWSFSHESFQPRHIAQWSRNHPSTCAHFSYVLYSFVWFILIMFSSTFNHGKLYIQLSSIKMNHL